MKSILLLGYDVFDATYIYSYYVKINGWNLIKYYMLPLYLCLVPYYKNKKN